MIRKLLKRKAIRTANEERRRYELLIDKSNDEKEIAGLQLCLAGCLEEVQYIINK